jgi:hypothetical protein
MLVNDVPDQLRAYGIIWTRVIEESMRFDWWLEMRKPVQ